MLLNNLVYISTPACEFSVSVTDFIGNVPYHQTTYEMVGGKIYSDEKVLNDSFFKFYFKKPILGEIT